jgi:hypothetical protein
MCQRKIKVSNKNTQRSGFCSEFYSWNDRRGVNEIREGRSVRKSLMKDGVYTQKIMKNNCLFLVLWLVRLGLEPSLCSPTMYVLLFIYFLWLCSPAQAMASSSTRFLDHTQRRTTVGRTPLDEWSARRRDLCLTKHNTHTHTHTHTIDKHPCPRWVDWYRGYGATTPCAPRP